MRPRVIATASFVAAPRSLLSVAGITLTLGLMTAATPLVAQSFAGARARADAQPGFFGGGPASAAGCETANTGVSSASASTGCSPVNGYAGTASASFTNGVLRSDARMVLTGAQISGTGSPGSELWANSISEYGDRVTFTAPLGVTLTSYRFSLGWSGTLVEPIAAAPGVVPFVQGALLFRGSGGPTTPIFWTGITRWFSNFPTVVEEFNGSFDGDFSQRVENGSLITSISGVSSFDGLLTSNTLDFLFWHYSDAALTNNSGLTQLVSGEVRSNFSNSAAITGLRLFAGDEDVTDLVQYSFASGFVLPAEVPEPSSSLLLLAAAGLMAMSRRAHRVMIRENLTQFFKRPPQA